MNLFFVVSAVLNFIASVVLTVVVYSSSGQSRVRRDFLFFLGAFTVWTAGFALWQLSGDSTNAHLYCQILIAAAAFIPVTFSHLALTLADRQAGMFIRIGFILATAVALFTPMGLIVEGVSPKLGFPNWPDAGPLFPLVILIFGVFVPFSAAVLLRGAREHVGTRSPQMRFVFISSGIGFIGGSTNFPLWFDMPVPPYGNFVVFIYLWMVGYGIYHRRISGINVDLFRSFIFLLITVSISLFYTLGFAAYGALRGLRIEGFEFWIHGVLAFIVSSLIMWLGPRLTTWVERLLDGVFRKDHLSSVARLRMLPVRVGDLVDERDLFETTCNELRSILRVEGAAVFLRGDFDSHYSLRFDSGHIPFDPAAREIDPDEPALAWLLEKPQCIVVDQVYEEIPEEMELALVRWKNRFGISVILPVVASHTLYGVILLGRRLDNAIWTEEETSLLFSVGSQIGINLRTRELERRAGEVDKLVALGTMAAGLAHEIRNPLVSVKTLASMISTPRGESKITEDFKQVLLRDVKRISNIVEGVSGFSQNRRQRFGMVDLSKVVESSLDIHRSEIERHGVAIEVRAGPVPPVQGDSDQLEQVVNNLIENAIHAVTGRPDPRLRLVIERRRVGAAQQWLDLVVSDNGPGIPENIRGRIFDPFITSKDTGSRVNDGGMGLGLAITKRIIDSHGGGIVARENPAGGAEFVVSLRYSGSDSTNGPNEEN